MSLISLNGVFALLICFGYLPINSATPQLNLRKLFGSHYDLRAKKDAPAFPQPDKDVLELEHLQHKTLPEIPIPVTDNKNDDKILNSEEISASDSIEDEQLEKQLEARVPKINNADIDTTTPNARSTSIITGQLEQEEELILQHRLSTPATQQQSQHNGEIENVNQNNFHHLDVQQETNGKPPAKSFYGAARLAFGQNPEVLPTTSTTTTSTVTTTVNDEISENMVSSSPMSILDKIEQEINMKEQMENNGPASGGDIISTTVVADKKEIPSQPDTPSTIENSNNHNNNNKEVVDDPIVAELQSAKTNIERRSVDRIPPKTAESLLKHADSSFDMAQYIFWTGDEAGVARAVEEFIHQGLMSRESALKFLKEIRLGIDYLQKSYENRVFAQQKINDYNKLNDNFEVFKKSQQPQQVIPTIYAENKYLPLKPNHLQQSSPEVEQLHQQEIHPKISNVQKTIESIPSLIKIREMSDNDQQRKDFNGIDDAAGRARLADFLYTEYTLEEVIYQLAKVMFSQSLTNGSEQSQRALQRLTNFLQTEGELGRISPALQKKVLDVLLAALSDTLANHPELLAAARANLGKAFNQLPPKNSLDSMKH